MLWFLNKGVVKLWFVMEVRKVLDKRILINEVLIKIYVKLFGFLFDFLNVCVGKIYGRFIWIDIFLGFYYN